MKRVCVCGAVTRTTPCDKCKAWKEKGRRYKKVNHKEHYGDGAWKSLSERFRADNPLCWDCNLDGRTEASTCVHHQVPICEDIRRRLDISNLVALCDSCHRARHKLGLLSNRAVEEYVEKRKKRNG